MNPNVDDPVERAIHQVERLYERVTGHAAPVVSDGPYAQIPAERDPAQYVEEQMERLARALGGVSEVASAAPEPQRVTAQPWSPPVSVWETEDRFLICVDLPGVPRANLSIAIAAGMIDISGTRPAPLDGGAELRWTERLGGRFARSIPLPPGGIASEMRAELEQGVLHITVPRSRAPRPVPLS